MYLYFDRNKVLREIINDEAIVKADGTSLKIYAYFEREEDETFTSASASFRLPSGKIVNTVSSAVTHVTNQYIPFNKDRDLKWFSYTKPYKFVVIDLGNENLVSVLSEEGAVAGTIIYNMSSVLYTMSLFTFMVEDSAVVAESVMDLSQFYYLQQIFQALPDDSTDGTYVYKAVKSGATVTYQWIKEE